MTATGQDALPDMRQPAPDHIDSGEAALRVIFLDPHPEVPETSYALGYLDGSIAGHMFAFTTGGVFLKASHASTHEQCYATSLRPLPLAAALSKHRDVHDLYVVGWLAGWRDSTVSARGALECVSCARRLFDGLDSVHRCQVDGVAACLSDCADDYCRRVGEDRDAHLVACFDEIEEPVDDCTAAVDAAVQ